MKILMLCHLVPYPANNGARMRILHLASHLAGQHQLTMLCPQAAAPIVSELQARLGPGACVVPVPWPMVHGQRRASGFASPFPRDVQPVVPAAAEAVQREVRATQPDMLLATDAVLGEYLRPYHERVRVVDIAADYNLYIRRAARRAPVPERPRWWLRGLKWQLYTRRLGQVVDMWVVPAAADRAALRRLLPAEVPVALVPNGVDVQGNAFAPNPDAPAQLAHCGALSYEPNADALRYFCRDIWPEVRQRAPDTQLVATGDSSGAPPEVRSAPGVTLTGYLPDIRPVLHTSRASIVPLRLGVGTRLKIMEAMALGTPVVSTSLGAEGLDVTDGLDIVLADTPAAFAEGVLRVLHTPDLRARLSDAGRRLVEARYAWPIVGEALLAALDDLMRQQRSEPAPAVGATGPRPSPSASEAVSEAVMEGER